jgi:hypothetical protein
MHIQFALYLLKQFNDTKGVIRNLHSKYRQCNYQRENKDKERFEDTKGVIRNRKTYDRKDNGNKDKITNTNLQNTTQKTTDRSTRAPEREDFNVPLVTTVVLLL